MGAATGENCGARGRKEGGRTAGSCGGVPAGKRSVGGGGSKVGLELGFAADGGGVDWGSGSGWLGGADSEGGWVAGEEAESAIEEGV